MMCGTATTADVWTRFFCIVVFFLRCMLFVQWVALRRHFLEKASLRLGTRHLQKGVTSCPKASLRLGTRTLTQIVDLSFRGRLWANSYWKSHGHAQQIQTQMVHT